MTSAGIPHEAVTYRRNPVAMKTIDRFRGCLIGLAAGDAVGTTVEFQRRGSFAPVTDMTGGGPFRLQAGQWTDDTAMALCLASSLAEKDGFDARDQMDRYCRWYLNGYFSSTGACFDIGATVRFALERYLAAGEPFSGPTQPNTAGNGCLMRLAPIPMYFFPSRRLIVKYASESSRTTHGSAECLDACRLFADILFRALSGADKEAILVGGDPSAIESPKLRAIARGDYRTKSEAMIRGSGYVVESLEAAMWSFARTGTFEQAILAAANLGDDADTTAAICGQVAGAYYGEDGIPSRWRERLSRGDEIRNLADRLFQSRPSTELAL